MKSRRTLSAAIAGLLICSLLSGCSALSAPSKAEVKLENNVLKDAAVTVTDGTHSGSSYTLTKGSVITADFSQPAEINTIILREKNLKANGFTIEAKQNGEYQKIYEQDDNIGEYRYCAFPTVKADGLRFTLLGCDGETSLKSFEAYLSPKRESADFRVTTYITTETAYDKDTLMKQAGSMDVVTDIIFFAPALFNENGDVWARDMELDGQQVTGRQIMDTCIQNLKALIGDHKIKIYCNFSGPGAPAGTPEKDIYKEMNRLHTQAMKDNGETLINNLIQFTKDYGMEGIFFDYEYPSGFGNWKAFGDFLADLKEAAGASCTVGAATPAWKDLLMKKAVKSVDTAEVMSYDMFDEMGYHSAFAHSAHDVVADYAALGVPFKNIDLGIPFYARPTDTGAIWYDYAQEAEQLGKFHNIGTGSVEAVHWIDGEKVTDTQTTDRYYNSYQMVYDKTAYAIDLGLGGVMTWHYGTDLPYENELSLFRAIKQAITDRTAEQN